MSAQFEAGVPVGGRYTLVAPLGEGGLGSVWEAEDAPLARRVALKLPRPGIHLPPSQLARIEREARVAASLDHENVVRILDYGVDLGFGPFIAMELLRGRTLEDDLAEHGTLRLRAILAWIDPVARALDAIHARGLVHRDVKPTNILRAELAAGSIVKLIDFGIAAYADGRERLTSAGTVIGTPEYMSPELAEGDRALPASDVYSLGVVAYEALTGNLPHDGGDAMAFLKAKTTTPARSLAETTGRIFSLRIEEAFERALHPDPESRPQKAIELVDALRACVR